MVAFADPALRIMTVGGVTATTVATAKTPAEGITAGVLTLVADSLTRPSGPPTIVTGPSYLVASALRELLRKNLSLDLDQVSESRAREIPERNLRPGGRYVLEVTTDINLFTYRPLAWGTYQYTLHAHARILSPQGVILWQNACIVAPMGPDKTLQLDRHGFQANGGQRLREVMKVAADRCALGMAPKQ